MTRFSNYLRLNVCYVFLQCFIRSLARLGAAETARLRAVLVEKDELLAHRTEEAARVEVLAAVVRVAEEAHVQDLETDVAQLTEKLRAEKEKRVALNVQLTAAANDFSALKEEAITARKDATDATMRAATLTVSPPHRESLYCAQRRA